MSKNFHNESISLNIQKRSSAHVCVQHFYIGTRKIEIIHHEISVGQSWIPLVFEDGGM